MCMALNETCKNLNGRAKRLKFGTGGTSGTCIRYVWPCDLAASKVISGSFGALAIFPKYRFQNPGSSTLVIIFQPTF